MFLSPSIYSALSTHRVVCVFLFFPRPSIAVFAILFYVSYGLYSVGRFAPLSGDRDEYLVQNSRSFHFSYNQDGPRFLLATLVVSSEDVSR